MDERERLAARFEEHRGRLRAVAYRMLGSAREADDAVQETWLRLTRADVDRIENLGGWLTTVVGRACLTMLRARGRRREAPVDGHVAEQVAVAAGGADPEEEAVLADSVGRAMLVVLDRLTPAERLAFVLHDTFSVPFEEIAALLDRSPAAARQLASRARRRVTGAPAPDADVARQRQVAEAYLAAARGRDFDALLALLDPEVVLRADRTVVPTPERILARGARTVATRAMAAAERARLAQPAMVDGAVGLVLATGGRLSMALAFTYADGRITEIDVIAEPERLDTLDIGVLDTADT
ncbi:MAG TPA: sigma-70 family RNA polymerase sigma factor [Acidimicrobiales bacterium]